MLTQKTIKSMGDLTAVALACQQVTHGAQALHLESGLRANEVSGVQPHVNVTSIKPFMMSKIF